MPADAPRKSYRQGSLDRADLDDDPLRQLEGWLRRAADAGLSEPNAISLSTVDATGRVSSRMVLLKGIAGGGLEFYSNYESRKGRDLEAHPQAAACFWWSRLERQVRLEGGVARLSEAVSDAYFASRPYGSQIAAWASQQSRPVEGREELERRFESMAARFPEGRVPRPPTWGGYRLTPERVEFWQGRENRLHDRFVYLASGDGWRIERLFP